MSAFRSSLLTHITGLEQPRAQREKRNFLKENVKNLRDMQKKMEAMKIKNAPTQRNLADPKGKRGFTSVQLRREGGVRKAKVFLASSSESSSSSSSSSSHPSAVSTPPTAVNSKARAGSRKLPGKTADPDPEKTVKNIVRECRDQSVQTADSEGVVRYPTNYCRGGGGENFVVAQPNQSEESAREKGQRHGQHGEGEAAPPLPTDNVENQQQKGQPIDYVKMNAKIHYAEKSPVKEKRDPTRPPPNYQKGVVPKYLQEIKKTNHNKSEDPKRGAGESLPAGHILLSDADRLDHLRLIRQSYAELVQQLNNLPVRSDSLRARTRRAEIEKELDRLERGIKLFSRDKLYVKVDA